MTPSASTADSDKPADRSEPVASNDQDRGMSSIGVIENSLDGLTVQFNCTLFNYTLLMYRPF